MRFRVNTKELKATLAVACKAVNPKSPLPILSHLLLEAAPESLSVTGWDMDTGVTVTIPADVQETGGVTLPASHLNTIIGLAGSKEVEINRLSEGRVEILASNGKVGRWELNSLPADEYPQVPALDGHSVKLPASALGNAIEEAAVAVAKSPDESRVVMTGICVGMADGCMTFVGTDGRRMAVSQRAIDFQGEVRPVSVPLRALAPLAKTLGSDGEVRLFITNRRIFFEHDNKRFFASLIEGRFPDWTKVVPVRDDWAWVCKVDRKELIEAVRGALTMAKEKRSPDLIRLTFAEDTVVISSNTPDLGEARLSLNAVGEGESAFPQMGVNGKYLLEGLAAIETETVLWELQSDTKSSVLRPDDDISFRYIVMPVKLRDIAEDFEREAAGAY